MSESLDQEIRTLQSIFWSERDPDGFAFAPLADAFVRKGELREALDLLTDGTSRHPEYATGHVVATRLYVEQGMYAEAEFAARRVLELDPENTVALAALVTVLHANGDAAEAAVARSALVGVDPDSEEARAAELLPLPQVPEGLAEPAALEQGGAHGELDDALDALGLSDTETEFASLDDLGQEPWESSLAVPDDVGASLDDGEAPAVDELLVPGGTAGDLAAVDVDFDPMLDLDAFGSGEDTAADAGLPIMELDSLAPDEPVMDLGALAPDDESVMDLGALAPDDESVLDLGALAPDEPTIDLGALAPDPEPVMDLGALAPDDEPVMDLGALAPDEPTIDLEALAPDEPMEADPVMDLGALAPDDEPVMELDALAPEDPMEAEPVMDLGALAPDGSADDPPAPATEDAHVDDGEPVYTRTLAELYVRQGFTDRARDVYRHLLASEPDARDLRDRLSELEGGGAAASTTSAADSDEHVETLARDLAESGVEVHDVDTPFAWTGDEDPGADAPQGEEDVAGYFEGLLDWGSREDA